MKVRSVLLILTLVTGSFAGAVDYPKFEGTSIQGRLVPVEGDWADDSHVTQYVLRDAEIAGQKLGDLLIYNPMLAIMTTPSAEIEEALRQGTVDGAPLDYVKISLADKAVALSELVTKITTPDAPQSVRLAAIELRASSRFPAKGSKHSCCLTFGK